MRLVCCILYSQNILAYLLLAADVLSPTPLRVVFYLIKGKRNDWFTNYTQVTTPTLPEEMYDDVKPMKKFNPWGSPGSAPIFGEGCGVNGGNPNGCHAGELDNNPYGTCCSRGMYRLTVKIGTTPIPCIARTVQSRFSDTLFSDKSRFSDNFAEDHFFST